MGEGVIRTLESFGVDQTDGLPSLFWGSILRFHFGPQKAKWEWEKLGVRIGR